LGSDSLEVGGRVDVEDAPLEFYLSDIGGTGFDERFRARIVGEREERFETGAIKERGDAESIGVTRGNDRLAGSFLLRDERLDEARIDERLIAGNQDDGVESGLGAEQMTQAGANGTAEATLPFRVLDQDRGRVAQFHFDEITLFADYDRNPPTTALAR
jgi:hypothetical protein